jgi:WD40 repeat protein
MEQVLEAVQFAHSNLIIHRDLKPSNILVTLHDGVPVPKIIDFGIAKAMDVRLTEKTLVTQFHAFIGTPAYTSPEQMEGCLDVDTRSDIYSLGVLLYELLTSRPPFDSNALIKSGLEGMRRTVLEVEPRRPSKFLSTLTAEERTAIARHRATEPPRLSTLLRGDLDWIVMRCLEKDRARRYPTASGLAVDIECHLNDELVSARPPSGAYRTQKYIRRHKVGFAAGAAVFAALVAGLIASSFLLVHERRARERAVAAERNEMVLRQNAQEGEANETLRASRTAVDLAEHHLAQDNTAAGLAYLVQAGRKDPHNRVVAPRLLSALTARGFFLPEAPALAFPSPARQAFFTAGGREIFVICEDSNIRVVDTASGRLDREFHYEQNLGFFFHSTPTSVAFAADNPGIFAARFVDDTVLVCDAKTGRPRSPPIRLGKERSLGPVLSPGGRWLATAGADTAALFDATTGELRATLPHKDAVAIMSLTFSPDGRQLITTQFGPRVARVWSVPSGVLLNNPIKSERGSNSNAAFTPDGRFFAVASHGAQIYNSATGEKTGPFLPHDDLVWTLCFTPDGRRLITASQDHVMKIWNVATGELSIPPLRVGGHCVASAINDEGSKINLVFKDGGGELWDINSGDRLAEIPLHAALLSRYQRHWSADGQHALVCTPDGKVHRLRLGGGKARALSVATDDSFKEMTFAPDAATHALWLTDNRARMLDVASGRETAGGFAYPQPVIGKVYLRSDQRVMVVEILPKRWQAWWVGKGTITQIAPLPDFDGGGPSFSPAGDRVAWVGNSRAEILSLRSGKPVGPTITFDNPVLSNADRPQAANFDPLGRHLVIGEFGGRVGIWDTAKGNLLVALKRPDRGGNYIALYSPDGTRIITTNIYAETLVWDSNSGRAQTPLFEPADILESAEYSRDGLYIVTAGQGRTARVWNTVTGAAIGAPMRHASRVDKAHFSPDGRRVVTASWDGTARIWDALTGQPLSEPLLHGQKVQDARFNADGRFIATSAGATQRIWSVPPEPADGAIPDWLLQLGTSCASQVLTAEGQLLDVAEEVVKIDDVRRQLAALPDNAPYVEWGRWFLADPATRSIAPGFTVTPAEVDQFAREMRADRAP